MTDFVRKMEDFIKQEKQVMKQFKDPDNIKAHKNYIARTISVMKNDALHQLMPLLEDKQRTLIRQYRGHNDELNRDIKELERDIKEIKSFTFRDEAIKMSKNSKLKSYLAQEFRDIKAILKKKNFKDAGSSEYEGMNLSEMKRLRSELMRKQERERAGSDKFHEYQKQISELTGYINRFRDAKVNDAMFDIFEQDVYVFTVKAANKNDAISKALSVSPGLNRKDLVAENYKDFGYNKYVGDARFHDARIELKMGGRTIGYIEADTLSEAVRRYEEEHPEARGKVDAYMADRRFSLKEKYGKGVNDGYFRDSLSSKAKQLIETAVREARYDYRTAIGFVEADLKAEKEWAWNNENEVKEYVRRLIRNAMD